VRVAAGDYDGDGRADIITSAGVGAGPHVKAIDAASGDVLASFYAYDPNFLNGIWVAAGDLDGDGKAEILAIPGPGAGPNVKVFQGGGGYAPNAIASFFAFDSDYTGGSRIAVPSA
jgi:serralysin